MEAAMFIQSKKEMRFFATCRSSDELVMADWRTGPVQLAMAARMGLRLQGIGEVARGVPSCSRGVLRTSRAPAHPESRLGRPRAAAGREQQLYEKAFAGLDREAGLALASLSHERKPRVPGSTWFYGELSFEAARDILERASPKQGDVFVDLGSGLGKMVLAAASGKVFGECRGIEILPELHDKANQALEELAGSLELTRCKLVCGDMLGHAVADADVVFSFATCFDTNIMAALETKLATEMKPGARLILVSKQVSQANASSFDPWGPEGGYVSVQQAHSKWNLDCFLYVKR